MDKLKNRKDEKVTATLLKKGIEILMRVMIRMFNMFRLVEDKLESLTFEKPLEENMEIVSSIKVASIGF